MSKEGTEGTGDVPHPMNFPREFAQRWLLAQFCMWLFHESKILSNFRTLIAIQYLVVSMLFCEL